MKTLPVKSRESSQVLLKTAARKVDIEVEITVVERRGVARVFPRGGWGEAVTACQTEGTRQIVTSFSPPAVGCLL